MKEKVDRIINVVKQNNKHNKSLSVSYNSYSKTVSFHWYDYNLELSELKTFEAHLYDVIESISISHDMYDGLEVLIKVKE